MSKAVREYYRRELESLDKSFYPHKIKVWDGDGNHTKTIDLNGDSIPEIIKWLIDRWDSFLEE
jgi:hypothetical protein